MARPILHTKFRGTGQTENEVFQNVGGTLTSLFTYGTAGLATDTDFKPGSLATHWKGAIYAIGPEDGIYKNTPPETSGVLLHSFTSPNTGTTSYVMDWQTVFKDGKQQLFTLFHTSTTNQIRMVFIDEEDNVTETDPIAIAAPASNMSFMRGLNFGNKIYTSSYTTSNLDVQITDPISQSISKIDVVGETHPQQDFAIHSGVLYMYTQQATTTVGQGNCIWNMSSAVPYKTLEWEGYQLSSNEFPNTIGQNLIFSDGDNLVVLGMASGTTAEELDMWTVSFDANGVPVGLNPIMDTVLGFRTLVDTEVCRAYATRDIETELGEIRTNIYFIPGNGSVEGNTIHVYEWNGPSTAATYLGQGADSFTFDAPSWKVGGGARVFSNQDELDCIITDVSPTGSALDLTYYISGSAGVGAVAMCPKFDNLKDSPLQPLTFSVIDKGFASGNYIAGLSTGESGIFRWDIASDGVSPGDLPTFGTFLIRTE